MNLNKILLKNSYPISIINNLLFNKPYGRAPERFPNVNNTNSEEIIYFYRSLPHIDELTTKLINVSMGENIKMAKRNVK